MTSPKATLPRKRNPRQGSFYYRFFTFGPGKEPALAGTIGPVASQREAEAVGRQAFGEGYAELTNARTNKLRARRGNPGVPKSRMNAQRPPSQEDIDRGITIQWGAESIVDEPGSFCLFPARRMKLFVDRAWYGQGPNRKVIVQTDGDAKSTDTFFRKLREWAAQQGVQPNIYNVSKTRKGILELYDYHGNVIEEYT